MTRRGSLFAGCTVALATPFKDGCIDFAALTRAIETLIDEGVRAVSPAGTTGEAPALSKTEQEELIATVVEHVSGRVRVLAGTGSNCTAEAVKFSRFAQGSGADGVLVVAPYYNRPNQDGLYAHYAAISEAIDLPIVLYNVPSRTGCNLEPPTVERLSRLTNIVAIKEASGSLDQVSDILARTDLTVLSGDDSLTLPMLAVGAEGVVSVAANIVPGEIVGLISAFERGDLATAQRIHARLFPLCRAMLSLGPNPVPLKAALEALGICGGELRLPLTALGPDARAKLSDVLADMRVLCAC
jgi:4-hydroxy-tetrahydrodipicolinate synthase